MVCEISLRSPLGRRRRRAAFSDYRRDVPQMPLRLKYDCLYATNLHPDGLPGP